MRINIETAGGGGVVLIIALALLASHGGGVGTGLEVAVIIVASVLGLAVLAGTGLLVRHVLRAERAAVFPVPPRVLPGRVVPSLSPEEMRQAAVVAAALRELNAGAGPDPAAVAEILRRGQRPE